MAAEKVFKKVSARVDCNPDKPRLFMFFILKLNGT